MRIRQRLTGIGSVIAFTAKRTNYRFLSIATGFSAGVMIYVSFVEIFLKGVESLAESYGEYWAHWVNAASFFGGMLLIGLVDTLIPAAENPHEVHSEEETALQAPAVVVPDGVQVEDNLDTLDAQLRRIGPINPLAAAEYRQLAERLRFPQRSPQNWTRSRESSPRKSREVEKERSGEVGQPTSGFQQFSRCLREPPSPLLRLI